MTPARYDAARVLRDPPPDPKGPHKRSAAWVRAVFEHSGLTQEAFAEKVDVSRAALTRWLDGEVRPRWDSRDKLRRIAPPHLKDVHEWERGSPAAIGERTLDPPEVTQGVYIVKTDEAAYIARRIDAIEDDVLREKVMEECSAKIRELLHPSELSAEKRPDRAQHR